MALKLAVAEGMALLVAVVGTLLISPQPTVHDGGVALAIRALVFVLCGLIAFYYSDFYEVRLLANVRQLALRLPRTLFLAATLAGVVYIAFPKGRVPACCLGASTATAVLLVLLVRTMAYWLPRIRPEWVLLVGSSPLVNQLIDEIGDQPHLGWNILGVVGDDGTDTPHTHRLGSLAQVDQVIHELRPDRIIVTLPPWRGKLPLKPLLKSRVRGTRVEDGVDVYERLTGKLAIENLTPTAVIFSQDFRPSPLHLTLNRGLSCFLAAIALLALAPALALVALVIRLESPGPVFFVQDRVGAWGRRFRLLKFRTMAPASERTSEWERDNKHRITRVGKWLRRLRVDELPQLINVLRGEMNLVGPRPHPVSNLPLFVMVLRNAPECGESIPYYSLRCTVPPGITGWAQVRYRYANDLDEETEKMRYDLYYIKHASVWLDLRILLDTLRVVLQGGGGASSTHPKGTAQREKTTQEIRRARSTARVRNVATWV